jgi:hypothetical protein
MQGHALVGSELARLRNESRRPRNRDDRTLIDQLGKRAMGSRKENREPGFKDERQVIEVAADAEGHDKLVEA